MTLPNHLIVPSQVRLHVLAVRDVPSGFPARGMAPRQWRDTLQSAYCPAVHDRPRRPTAEPDLSKFADSCDPALAASIDFSKRTSVFGQISCDAEGRPLNPIGPTGLAGRGDLWLWGPNHSVNVVITRPTRSADGIEFLSILRSDVRLWSVIGGFVDATDVTVVHAGVRESREEAGILLPLASGRLFCAAYLDSARNTDHAWIENHVLHWHLSYSESLAVPLHAGSDAAGAQWAPATPEHAASLFASSGWMVMQVAQRLLNPVQRAVQTTLGGSYE